MLGNMTVHFICKGNVFRSLMAEAYLKSLHLPGVTALSSGAIADLSRERNIDNLASTNELLRRHGLGEFTQATASQLTQARVSDDQVVVCMNAIADEAATGIVDLPADRRIWDVTDIGEGDRLVSETVGRDVYEEDVYNEIVTKVDELVTELKLH